MSSLRRTLAVRFAATMAVGLLVTSVGIWWAASAVLHSQLDQGITATAFLVANELAQTADCPVTHELAVNATRYRRDINRFIVIRDPQCKAIQAIPGWAMDLPADSAAIGAARDEARSFSVARWHDLPIRSTYVAVAGNLGATGRVVQVGASLGPIWSMERTMLLALLGLVVVGTGATFVGAWRLASSAVRPVMEITEQATHVEAGTLDQRISAHAAVAEYGGLVAVLNRMLDRLAGAFAIQRRFTSDISHELRTPLTAVQGEIEVTLRADRTPREYQLVLRSALEEIERMTVMTEELLLINRIESRQLTLHRTPTDVNAVVTESLERLRHRIADKELQVERDAPTIGPRPDLDADLVRRLVDELLDNAVTYAEIGGTITVGEERTADLVRLVVEDTGPGIAAADLPHIFEPYYRADQVRTRGDGAGLGLTAAAAIARLHGGDIRAMNRPDGGARIEVDFTLSNL